MFIRQLTIENIRSIENLNWRAPKGQGAGWNVILGDNGSGKSSFLRSMTLALLGPEDRAAARQDWSAWLRAGKGLASIEAYIFPDAECDPDASGLVALRCDLIRTQTGATLAMVPPDRPMWESSNGWFSAAYGPFRRFSGGDNEAEKLFLSNPRLGAHISVLGENIALTESLSWLRELNYKRLEHSPEGHILNRLKHFVNQDDFLPHGIKLREVSSRGVEFEDASGLSVAVEELSDGYRSILSMTFELIRQMVRVYSEDRVFDKDNQRVVAPGVVMIDEVDAHLHPTWQKKVGFWFTKHFPNIQFFVTTHSPLICQAAVNGSIFRLPTPGTKEVGKMLEGSELDRLLYGDILDAYSTEAFGTADTRSREAHAMQERLAVLNVKELKKKLTAAEADEQERLRAAFPTSPHVVSR